MSIQKASTTQLEKVEPETIFLAHLLSDLIEDQFKQIAAMVQEFKARRVRNG